MEWSLEEVWMEKKEADQRGIVEVLGQLLLTDWNWMEVEGGIEITLE